ncbi:MAG TPA: riboflavin synthase [Vicinamibacterales bacterium]|nr:riboflavin synthase [Vicinamibacterales bacterium]
MFSGLVEAVGQIVARERVPDGARLTISAPWADLAVGESVAVNGVCLTVAAWKEGAFQADAGPETLRVTTLGALRQGDAVNLERALRAGDRVGGHFVQGHVDATGRLLEIRPASEFTWMSFSFPPEHAAWIIPKGAIAVDGVSLTVATLGSSRFEVQVIPFTWTQTTLSKRRVGDAVNLEFDLLGKYAVRAAQLAAERHGAIAPSLR